MYANVSFSIKLQVVGWKKTPVQVRYCEFYVVSKNDYLVEHVQTVASDILGYPYVGYLLQGPYWGNAVFSSILTLIHFKINFRVLHNLKGVFRTVSNIYDEAFSQKYFTVFSRCIFAEMLQGFDRVLHTALQPSFFIFFHFLRLDTWMNDMNILLLFGKCADTFLTWLKLEIL